MTEEEIKDRLLTIFDMFDWSLEAICEYLDLDPLDLFMKHYWEGYYDL